MLDNYINYKNLIKFTQKLIQTPSESRKEEKIAYLIAKEMKELNYDEIDIDEKFNVYGKINGKVGKPNLLFNGHIDHAEAGSMKNPFSGEILSGKCFGYNGEVIYGRGASDMKAGVAAMIYAVAASKKLKLKGNVLMTAVALEEMGFGEGINYLFDKKKIHADFAVNGEATNLNIYIGHRGDADWKITTKGKTSHAGYPQGGVNSIFLMNQFINYVKKYYPIRKHDLLGDTTYTILAINSFPGPERKSPITPDRCEIVFNACFYPEDDKEKLENFLRDIINKIKKKNSKFNIDFELLKWFPSMLTQKNEKIVKSMVAAYKKVVGCDNEKLGAWYFGTEGAILNKIGIPTVGFGPGNEYLAHSPEDYVPLKHLEISANVYLQLINDLCT